MFRPLVLMYHGFGFRAPEQDPFNLFVRSEDLDRQLRTLARWFRPIDLETYLRGLTRRRWPARSVLVTMDDGYVSTLEVAAPLLARHGIPAVLFACPGRLGKVSAWMPEMPDEAMLTADQLRELPGHGIEIGAHGVDHVRLDRLEPAQLQYQVAGCREILADLTGTVPRAFAYPEGVFDDGAVRAVRAAGYEAAFSVERPAGSFAIPRVGITARDSRTTFSVKLVPGFAAAERWSRGRPAVRHAAAWLARQRGR